MRALTVVLAFACGTACAAADAPGDPTRLRVVAQPYLSFAALHVAQAEGFFRDEGLEVELVPMAGTEPAVPLLVSGNLDVLPGMLTPSVLNAVARGEPVRIVAARSGRPGSCSSLALVIRPGLLDGNPPSIDRISIDRQAVMLFFVETALAHAGLDLARLEPAFLPHAAEAQALASGAIDAALAGEPFLTRLLESGHAERWIGNDDVLPGVEYSYIFFGSRLLEDHSAGERFLAAYLRAIDRLAEGPSPRNIQRVAEATGEDPELLRRTCWPFGATDGRVRVEDVARFQSWMAERGLVDRPVPPSQLWDSTFMTGARRAAARPHPDDWRAP